MTQVLGSSVLLFSLNFNYEIRNINRWISSLFLFQTALIIKIGAAPLHFWFPEVVEGLRWFSCSLLLTWQKLAPIVITLIIINISSLIYISIISSSIIGRVIGINQNSIRKILAYSSINHTAWILVAIAHRKLWTIYFLIYCLINLRLTFVIWKINCFKINQLSILSMNPIKKLSMVIIFLSLAGLPPLIGFLPKWILIYWIRNNQEIFLITILIITTLIIIYVYFRIIFSSIIIINLESLIKVKTKIRQVFIIFRTTFSLRLLFTRIFLF